MGKQKFSKKQAIKFGWNTVRQNIWFFACIVAFVLLVAYLPEGVSRVTKNIQFPGIANAFFFIFSFIFWVLNIIISIGVIYISIEFVRGRKPKFSDLFTKAHRVIDYFVSSVLYSIITVAGLIALIIPGIIFMTRFQFYQYFVVEKDTGPIEALKKSWRITDGEVINLIFLWFLVIGINILGGLAFGVGLFVSIPVTMIAMAYVYKELED